MKKHFVFVGKETLKKARSIQNADHYQPLVTLLKNQKVTLDSGVRELYSGFAEQITSLMQKNIDIRIDNPAKCLFQVTLTSLNDEELAEVSDLPGKLTSTYNLEKKSIKFSSMSEISLNLVDSREKSTSSDFYTKMKEEIKQKIYLPPFESRAFEVQFTGCV